MEKLFLCGLFLLLCHFAFAQSDTTKHQNQYISISSQNDFYQYWLQSDKHFTNGLHVTVSHRTFENRFMDWFLLGQKNATQNQFSLSLGQDMHTPENASSTEVDSTDRPYAGLLYFTYSKTSSNYWRATKIISNFYFGVQGPAALGGETQNFMHYIFIDNNSINGWHNQIGNGLILDYDVSIQKMLPINGKFFETNVSAKGHIGTIYNYLLSGLQFKIGRYNDTYYSKEGVYQKSPASFPQSGKISNARKKQMDKKGIGNDLSSHFAEINRQTQLYLFTEFQIGALFYDGTALGSLIQFESSPYLMTNSQIDPLILNFVYGLNFGYKRWMLRYYRIVGNSNFQNSDLFGWGEISLFYGL